MSKRDINSYREDFPSDENELDYLPATKIHKGSDDQVPMNKLVENKVNSTNEVKPYIDSPIDSGDEDYDDEDYDDEEEESISESVSKVKAVLQMLINKVISRQQATIKQLLTRVTTLEESNRKQQICMDEMSCKLHESNKGEVKEKENVGPQLPSESSKLTSKCTISTVLGGNQHEIANYTAYPRTLPSIHSDDSHSVETERIPSEELLTDAWMEPEVEAMGVKTSGTSSADVLTETKEAATDIEEEDTEITIKIKDELIATEEIAANVSTEVMEIIEDMSDENEEISNEFGEVITHVSTEVNADTSLIQTGRTPSTEAEEITEVSSEVEEVSIEYGERFNNSGEIMTSGVGKVSTKAKVLSEVGDVSTSPGENQRLTDYEDAADTRETLADTGTLSSKTPKIPTKPEVNALKQTTPFSLTPDPLPIQGNRYTLPSSEIKASLLSINEVLWKYLEFIEDERFASLAGKLALEAVIGEDVLKKCTPMGKSTRPGLPTDSLYTIKKAIFNTFPKYWERPDEFEKIWQQKCILGIACICSRLRNPNTHKCDNKTEMNIPSPSVSLPSKSSHPTPCLITNSRKTLPSSVIERTNLISVDEFMSLHSDIIKSGKYNMAYWCRKLALDSIFGPIILAKCTPFGGRIYYGLPIAEMNQLKQAVLNCSSFWDDLKGFEEHWNTTCIKTLQKVCSDLKKKTDNNS